ncbi:MAG: sodium:solute symporter [Chitinophagaceae bacterium]|nr:sodium:solute symporter [Chitinophagaceae bacterium]
MGYTDWIVLAGTLVLIISYGIYKSHTTHNLEGYFLSNHDMPWYLVLLSIMGTQASAITFVSAPGQAFTDGMRFVQYYFGLPLAMIVISIVFVPVFRRMKVYTAYEFLEERFDGKARTFTSFLFQISRGLSTGISIYAPSLILSSLLGWNIYYTNVIMGGLLIIYTVSGGARAVAHTQKLQLIIIFAGMFLAGYLVVKLMPENIHFKDALKIGGENGKMNVITSGFKEDGSFDWEDKYNIWSGLIGGLFLALSYFGTDHSQVGRYLTAKSAKESKLGLLMNGVVKVPMQFMILLLGVLVFSFYKFQKAPLHFNEAQIIEAKATQFGAGMEKIEAEYALLPAGDADGHSKLRKEYTALIKQALPNQDVNDTNYIFLRFVLDYLPEGLIGLLIAIIFLASWGSVAAALNSLAACTMVDIHKRYLNKDLTPEKDYRYSKLYTLLWGVFCIFVAQFAGNIGNSLIETVNILGSIFYGVILGIFLIAFWVRYVRANALFYGALISQLLVFLVYKMDIISFLWLNVIGCVLVICTGVLLQRLLPAGITNR